MALQSSGAISLANIAAEFGGSAPHSLSEYYGAASGIPSSGAIDFADFYGKSAFPSVIATNGTAIDAATYVHSGSAMVNPWYLNTGYGFVSTGEFRTNAIFPANVPFKVYVYGKIAKYNRAGTANSLTTRIYNASTGAYLSGVQIGTRSWASSDGVTNHTTGWRNYTYNVPVRVACDGSIGCTGSVTVTDFRVQPQ